VQDLMISTTSPGSRRAELATSQPERRNSPGNRDPHVMLVSALAATSNLTWNDFIVMLCISSTGTVELASARRKRPQQILHLAGLEQVVPVW